jgi:hypothetical protein
MRLTELAILDGRRPLPLWDVIGLTLNFNVTYFSAPPLIYSPECLAAMLAGISNNVI